MLCGVMMERKDTTIEHGLHVKAMINAVLPVFLAGIALQDPEQRDYLESMLQEIYTRTGWRSIMRVLQGLDLAWQRKSRSFQGMPSLDLDPDLIREQSSTPVPETRYVLMDKPQILNSCAGVLGKQMIGRNYLNKLASLRQIGASPEFLVNDQLQMLNVQM